MHWAPFDSAQEFLDHTREEFLRDEVLYGMPLGVAQGLVAGRKYSVEQAPVIGRLVEGEATVAYVLWTPPRPLQWIPLRDCIAVQAWQVLGAAGIVPAGLNGQSAYVRELAEARCAVTGERAVLKMETRAHRLTEVRWPTPMAAGSMRKAREEEIDLMCQWSYRFAVDCSLPESIAAGVPKRQAHLALGDLYVWDVEGRAVSSAALTRESPHGRTLSFVYTPDAERGRGYASALVAHLSQAVLDSGKAFCTLFTDTANPTSNKIYRGLGYEPLAKFSRLDFEARG